MINKKAILILFILYTTRMFPQYIDSTYTNREDGRFLSTYGYVLSLLEKTKPQLAYNPHMSQPEFQNWKESVRKAMLELMKFPEVANQPGPIRLSSDQREGYIPQIRN